MSEVIVVTSGKGGVGKTTTTANVGTGLAMLNKKVVAALPGCIDRYGYRSSESGCCHGTGEPHRI